MEGPPRAGRAKYYLAISYSTGRSPSEYHQRNEAFTFGEPLRGGSSMSRMGLFSVFGIGKYALIWVQEFRHHHLPRKVARERG